MLFVERLGVRVQRDGPLAAIDGLLTWQEFQSTIAAIVGGPVALAERRIAVERDGRRGVVTFGHLTDGSAARLREALSAPVNGQDC
ncbi:hypothetical protein [Phytohabitans houttuyneae]|jgi:hypothetical protein|nr:hypothetical protein [Phytohabitans houttuyneae]